MLINTFTIIALAAAAVQILLMGVIGYPLARRRPGGMRAFQRSGFTWWIITLTAIVTTVAVFGAASFAPMAPSDHDPELSRLLLFPVVGTSALIVFELVFEWLTTRYGTSPQAKIAKERYDSALPRWAYGTWRTCLLLVVIAVLEECVFRAIALGGLIHGFGLSKLFAAGVCVVAFGLCHWYYGWRQIALKTVDGAILVWVALGAGWVAAAVAHAVWNVVLTLVSSRRDKTAQTQSN